MSIDKLQTVIDDNALSRQLTMHLGVFGRVERHEIIRHNATAAINHTMLAQGVILQRVGQVNAVLIGKLTMLVSLVKIHRIILTVALLIRLLDASAAWRIVMGNGETDFTAIFEGKRTLHQSLAKGSATHHYTTVLILYSTGNDFSRRSRKLISEDNNLALAPATISLSTELLTGSSTTIGIDYQITLLQELISYLRRSLQIASTIILQVEDKVFHALLLQRIHRLGNLLVARHSETSQTDITNARTNHIGSIHRGNRNLITFHLEGKLILDAAAHNGKVYNRTLRTTEPLHDFLLAHLDARNGSIIYRHNTVAGDNAHLLGRTIGNRLDDQERIIYHIKLHADAIKRAIQRLVHRLSFLGSGIGRMRVQLFEHSPDGVLYQLILIHTIHIEIGNGDFSPAQLLYRAILAHFHAQLGTDRSDCQECR